MNNRWSTAILGVCIFITFGAALNWRWKIDESFDGKIKFSLPHVNYSIKSLDECVKACLEWVNCSSFFYNCETSWCTTQEATYITVHGAVGSKGTRYFRLLSDECPMDWGYYMDRVTGMCVKFIFRTINSFNEARTLCNNNFGKVVSLETSTKYKGFVRLLLQHPSIIFSFSKKACWVGARLVHGQYMWVSGTEVAMPGTDGSIWESGKPTNSSDKIKDCVALGVSKTSQLLFNVECEYTSSTLDYFIATACDFDSTAITRK